MKMYIDDLRTPKHPENFDWIARSSEIAIVLMERYGCPQFISFDHDLGGEDTAMVVVKWMIEMDLDMSGDFIPCDFDWNVHSANPVGAANLNGYLKAYFTQKDCDERTATQAADDWYGIEGVE